MDYSTSKFVTDSNQGMQGRFESSPERGRGGESLDGGRPAMALVNSSDDTCLRIYEPSLA